MPQPTLYCEHCGKPLGPALLACPARRRGTCPYRVTHSKLVQSDLFGWIFLLVGLGGVIITPILYVTSILTTYPFFTLPFGLLLAGLGTYAVLTTRLTLYNPETGQMWEQIRVAGLPISQRGASALEPVPLHMPELHRLQHPASISALYLLSQGNPRTAKRWVIAGTNILYATILSLVGQEYLSLRRSTRFKGRKSEQLFALDIKGGDTVTVQGALESRIVQAVAEWSRRTDSSIKVGNMTFSRQLRHCFVVYDLVRVVMNGRWNNPGSHLVTAIVGPDAEQRGVGQRKGVLITRFDLPPETAALVRPDYDVLNNAVKRFEATYPDVASDLRARIKKAVEYCIDSH